MIAGDPLAPRPADELVVVAADDLAAVSADALELISADAGHLITHDGEALIVPHTRCVIVARVLVEVALRGEDELLCPGAILEQELVGAAAARGALRSDTAPRLLLGERLRDRGERVVDAPEHERPIGIAPEKSHDDFHAHPRDELKSPRGSGQRLDHANPAGAVLVVLPVVVPVELDLDPPVLVGVNLLARGPDDSGALHDLSHLGLGPWRAHREARRSAFEAVGVHRLAPRDLG